MAPEVAEMRRIMATREDCETFFGYLTTPFDPHDLRRIRGTR
jgi:hypothetical protein